MKPFEEMEYHPTLSTIVDVISKRTQNKHTGFFVIQAAYHLAKLAAMMRVTVDAQGYGQLGVNMYGIALGSSGCGKGYSTNIIENEVIHLFRQQFMDVTYPSIAEINLANIASQRSIKYGEDYDEVLEKVKADFKRNGTYLTTFDSGTTPALKQLRTNLLMSSIGSINLEVDEFASNLLGNKEMLDAYLELYDGSIKQKLVKNTAENQRQEEIVGKTPTNMFMFGTPTMLFDGGQAENMFMLFLQTGYARRCFFGLTEANMVSELTKEERKNMLTDKVGATTLQKIAVDLVKLTALDKHNTVIKVDDDVLDSIIDYQMYCESLLSGFKSTDEIRKAEAKGRYYKTIRLAGAFAFLDDCTVMKQEHWESAVKVAELSAKCFYDIMSREPNHARLAKYLTECPEGVTYPELIEDLPYFPKAAGAQKELVKNAIAWGYRNHVVIKRSFVDDIEFISGESLKETQLDKLILSYSVGDSWVEGYTPRDTADWKNISKICLTQGVNWCNHRFIDDYRKEVNVIQGFNLIVLDIDSGTKLEAARSVLDKYTYFIHTTKRHTDTEHRFRIVIPTSHTLSLKPDEFKQFMRNIMEFLPFELDEQTAQASRKWSANGLDSVESYENVGELFDVLPFIPKTKKNEERVQFNDVNGSMDKLERFFYSQAEEGNRNNTLFKYGAVLVDAGYPLDTIKTKLFDFNKKLPKPIDEERLTNTVLESTMKKFFSKG